MVISKVVEEEGKNHSLNQKMNEALCRLALKLHDALFLFTHSAVHKPHVERRVKTIVEEIVDGRVVSTVVDTETQEVQ